MNKTIRVLDHDIKVVFSDPEAWAEDAMGRCDMKRGEILINSTIDKGMQGSTFMHELVHMIADMNNIEISEQSVDGFALGMTSFIRNNPKFINEVVGRQ